jgi:hypothetical protein
MERNNDDERASKPGSQVGREVSRMSAVQVFPESTHRHRPQSANQWRPLFNVIREVAIVGLAAFVYFFVRGLIHSRESEAIDNAQWLVSKEQALGIFHEAQVQEWILGHPWLVDIANSVYIYGHWPVVAGTLIWLFARHREAFPVFRTAMIVSGLIGFFFFFLFPMAPPRFLDGYGFIDTVTLHSEAYRVLQPPSLTNQFAAMPSLHVGWNLLMGIAIFHFASNRAWKAFGLLMPLAMYSATILTANHYFLDGVVGSLLALTGLAIAWKLSGPKVPVWTERRMGPERVTRHSLPA